MAVDRVDFITTFLIYINVEHIMILNLKLSEYSKYVAAPNLKSSADSFI